MDGDEESCLPANTVEHASPEHEERNKDLQDMISELPHEILVSILSLMTFKEAVRTSVLSRRWKKLWSYTTGSLDFEDSKAEQDISHNTKSLGAGRFKFIGWVNRMLNSHQGSRIREFRVRFDLNNRSRRYVDEWVAVALAKRVQNLKLDFLPFLRKFDSPRYTFPSKFILPSAKCRYDLSCLRSLDLKFVNLTDENLDCILTSCPFLEELVIVCSELLSHIKVKGSSLSLKHLFIHCSDLTTFEVSAPNLVSLAYHNASKGGPQVLIENAPLLTSVTLGALYDPVSIYLHPLCSSLPQLEALHLHMNLFKDGLEIPQFPMLFNLRYLTWLVQTSDTASLLGLTSLIEAAPFLHHFELKLEWTEPWRRRNAKRVNATPNQYLKEVKILGFRGYAIDSEIISYLLERATMLEEIVVDPHPHACLTEGTFMEEKQAARKKAEQLKPKLPHAAKLIIL
ncbi:F-box protein At5g03100-like isoform X2 [Rhodamnia argentea]|uniref:F-box protein At5g03100-like isoform X2 n=1 Tax=Rhodamnia argentea TaxID=178133 RepID=A0A8B8Q6T4_9MYRT|nr:F-box protein At5g03100-like isoform X2 [Rhodamnia argentea]